MKVVLLQDVKALGKKGTIVEVAEGYARNFLLPKKLGAPATAENLNTLKLKKANEERVAAALPPAVAPETYLSTSISPTSTLMSVSEWESLTVRRFVNSIFPSSSTLPLAFDSLYVAVSTML